MMQHTLQPAVSAPTIDTTYPGHRPNPTGELIIDCDTCVMRRTDVCGQCVVTFLIDRDERGAVVLDFAEVRAMAMLAEAGMVPTLRHRGRR